MVNIWNVLSSLISLLLFFFVEEEEEQHERMVFEERCDPSTLNNSGVTDLTLHGIRIDDLLSVHFPRLNTLELHTKMWFEKGNNPSDLFNHIPTLERVYVMIGEINIMCTPKKYTIVYKQKIVSEGDLLYAESKDLLNNALEEELVKCTVSYDQWCCEKHFDECVCTIDECGLNGMCNACSEALGCVEYPISDDREFLKSASDCIPKEKRFNMFDNEILEFLKDMCEHTSVCDFTIDDKESKDFVDLYDVRDESEFLIFHHIEIDDEYGYEQIKSKSRPFLFGAVFGCIPPHSNIFYILNECKCRIDRYFYDKYVDAEEKEKRTWIHLVQG